MKKYLKIIFFGGLISIFTSCVKNHEPLNIKDKYYFTDIVKIFEKNGCNSCHSSVTKSYSQVITSWVDTTIAAEETKLYKSIEKGGSMNQYITNPDIDIILKWIQDGALEGDPIIDTTNNNNNNNNSGDSSYYSLTIHPIFKNSCLGCHHDNSEIIYENIFKTNSQGFIWIQDKNSIANSLLYQKITTGSMKDYLVEPNRTTVMQWLNDGANKTKYAFDKDIKPMFIYNCVACHDFAGTYSSVISNWVDTTKVSTSTLLYQKIRSGGSMYPYMPTSGDSVTVVREWIKEGAIQ